MVVVIHGILEKLLVPRGILENYIAVTLLKKQNR